MKTILGYLRPHAPRVAVGVTVKFSAAVLELLLPLLLAHIIDGCVPARDLPGVFRAGGWMLVMAFGAALCNITANRMAAWVSMDVTRQLRRDLYRRTLFLSQAQMDRFSVSSIVSRLTNDTYNVHQMFDKIQRGGIRAPMLVLGGMVLTFLQAPPLALVQLAVCSATFFAICWVTRRGIPRYARAQEAVDTVVRIIRENAAGVRVVKALSCQGRERDRFAAASQAAKEAEETAGSVMAAANPLSDFLLNLGLVLVVLAGAALVIALTLVEGSGDYNGAGGQIIEHAVEGRVRVPWAFALKMLFTALTLGAGFKGGEIVPTLFIGSTFGCAAAPLLGLEPSFGAAVGMIALFCGVTNCPLASILLSVELFGSGALPFFALACALAFLLSGRFSLYSSQKIVYSKLEARLNDQYQTEQEKERLSC